jgi:hypothetical protein
MAQPLIATFRMVITPLVHSFSHKIRVYVDSTDIVAPFQLINRDSTTVSFQLAVQGFWDAIRRGYLAATTGAATTAVLEQRIGTAWIPVEFATLTGNGQSTETGTEYGQQTTITLRDATFKKVKVVMLETPEPFNNRGTSVANTNSAGGVAQEFTAAHTVTNPPFDYVVGRSAQYLANTGTFVAWVSSSNRKVRRARGIA